MASTSTPELYQEYPEPDERDTVEQLVALLRGVVEQHFFTGLHYRDVHVKGHAAVRAEFVVDADLPQDLRVGVFKDPRTFPAWIRYSNSNHVPSPDIRGDIRGLAIKLVGVPGRKLLEPQQDADTHDFVFLSTDVFLTGTARDFYKFVKAGALNYRWSAGDLLRIAGFILTHLNVGFGLIANSKKFASLLEMDWYSATPYRFGDRAVKYRLKPRQPRVSQLPSHPAHNYLRERLAADLAREGAWFDFMIQFQRDPRREPIENALVPWDERHAPFRKVASVWLPRQTVDTPERRMIAENLSMNPWHCLPEHRPIGGVNRVRKEVYFAISQFRHERNGVLVHEPQTRPPAEEA